MRKRRLEARARTVAKASLAGMIGPAEACESLSRFALWVPDYFRADDRTFLQSICNKTSDFPVGERKTLWHPDFIGARLEALQMLELAISDDVRGVCERVIAAKVKKSLVLEP